MTTRVSIFGGPNVPLEARTVAIGGDGKYETFQGNLRLKWNSYDYTQHRIVRTKGRDFFGNDRWFNGGSFKSSTISSNDILTAQSRLLEAVKGHQFNLAVNAAQGKQTVGMVVNAVTSIGGAISDLKKGRFENAARRFGVAPRPSKLSEKDISGRWLELQYGWLPLISDVYEASKAYESITNGPRVGRVRGSISKSSTQDCSESPTLYHCYGTQKDRHLIIYEFTEQMSVARQLGLADPATVVWELIPYSFVVDWFLPIGNYLENLNQIPTLSGRFLTIKSTRYQGGNTGQTSSPVNWTKIPTISQFYLKIDRVVSSSLSVPKPQFNKLSDAMSPTRIWNAIALVTQRLR